jgi:hypothetical protein
MCYDLTGQRSSWEDDRVGLAEIGWEFVDWMHVAQNMGQWLAVVNTVMDLGVP